MLRLMLVFILGIWLRSAFTQTINYADSLQGALLSAVTMEDSLLPARQLARYYMRHDIEASLQFSMMYQRLANQVGDVYQIAVSDHYLGLVYRLQGNYSAALQHFASALNQFESKPETLPSCLGPLFNIGVIHQIVGDYDQALDFFYQELQLRDSLGIKEGYGNTLNSIGVTLKKMGDYHEALQVYEEALKKSIAAGDSIDLSNIYNNRGSVKELTGDYDGAFADYRTSLALDKKDDYESGIASSYEAISKLFLHYGEYDSAKIYGLRSFEIRKKLGQLKELVESSHYLVSISLETGNIDDAWMYAEITTPKCEELGLSEMLMNNYKLLAEIYHQKGEEKLEAQALRAQLFWKDSLMDQRALETARNLQVRYETKEKEQVLHSLTRENELNALLISRQQKWQYLLLVALGLLAFFLVLAIRFYQLKIEAHQLRAEQEKILEEKRIKEFENANQLMKMNAVLQGQETERLRIAKDLHDGLGALLSTVKLHFASVQKEIDALSKLNVYQKANELLDNACSEVRRIAHNMMPDALSNLGLVQALEDLLEGLRLKGQKVSLETINMEDQEIPEETELTIYRIIQELINNITRHAQANSVIVQLSVHENELFISVEDDGRGFDMQKVSDGIGLKNIRSRVAYLGGTMEMESTKNIGTTTNIVIPLSVYSRTEI
ncbi:MAG: sensor histidine kinase [Saprospiraceae bacterium]|nr:sensor histidine kinase [Saprospiraceae bacterium]